MPASAAPVRYRFGHFELQLDERRLLSAGAAVALRPLAFDVLTVLVERAGHLVTKTELLRRVWGQVVVEENALQAHVSALRRVLGVPAIATVSGQGYRFTLAAAPVEALPAPATPHNLPHALTSFIGREREIADIRRWLESTRLLTLTGAGGCGKTRLALVVAGAMLEQHPDGVWLVDLAPLGDPKLVPWAVAKALAIQAPPGQEIADTLIGWLASRRVLLVLDNAEHLLDACAQLADRLLRQCARLALLVTSRERLGIEGELNYRVPSLSMPADDASDGLLASEAVRLLVDRARLQRPDFEATAADAPALAAICRRLDGIALAIELAAPRVRVMSLEALSQRLDDRFRVLTEGSRTALPRHRTLRSLIDWSHELLSGPEKAVLRRASVFAGGWTLAAAEQIASGEGVAPGDLLDLLAALVDKNLVITQATQATDGDPRFKMLETVRHYAQDRLRESGEEVAVRDRHVQYLIGLAGALDGSLDAVLQQTLPQLDAEQDNLRAALAWCEGEPARAVQGLRLASLLVTFWQTRGNYGEGVGWLERLLALAPADERGPARAMALHGAGALVAFNGDQAAAEARLREAADLWQQLGDRQRLAASLANLAEVLAYSSELVAARAMAEEALSIAREFGDLRTISFALAVLAQSSLSSGDLPTARTWLSQCLAVARSIGPWNTAATLTMWSLLMQELKDLEASRAALQESLQGFIAFGDRGGAAYARMQLAKVAQDLGDLPAARAELRRAFDGLPRGQYNELLEWLDVFAGALEVPGHAVAAAGVWGCVQRHREERALFSMRPARLQRLREVARHALQDDDAFDRAWQEGRRWSLEEAREQARSLLAVGD